MNKTNDFYMIDLKEFLWRIAEKWKIIGIIALIVGLIFTLLSYRVSIKEYEQSEQVIEELMANSAGNAEAVLLSSLNDDDRLAVNRLLSLENYYYSEQEYLDTSILLNSTANNKLLTIKYEITSQNADTISKIAALYNSYIASAEFAESLKPLLAPDLDLKYTKELINPTYYKNEFDNVVVTSNMISMQIVLPEGTGEEDVLRQIDEYIKKLIPTISQEAGDHSINLIFTDFGEFYNPSVEKNAYDVVDRVSSIGALVAKARQELSVHQRQCYDCFKQIEESSSDKEDVLRKALETTAGITRPDYSKKAFVGAFLATLFVLICVGFVFLTLRDRVYSPMILAELTGVDNIGSINCEEQKTTLLHKLIDDQRIHLDRIGNNTQKQLKETIDILNVLEAKKCVRELCLVCIPKISEKTDSVIESITEASRQSEITTKTIELDNKDAGKDIQHLVFVVEGDKTKVSEIKSVSKYYKQLGAEILGTIFIYS